jgi:hypothetical protein
MVRTLGRTCRLPLACQENDQHRMPRGWLDHSLSAGRRQRPPSLLTGLLKHFTTAPSDGHYES